jgi:hypothetical protein
VAGPLPRVLAGPIVRRVEQRSCSFWVALSQEATVKASLWKGERSDTPDPGSDPPAGTGELKTRRIGTALHVAVVTVDLTGVAPLEPGALYSYTLGFVFTGGGSSDLKGEKLLDNEQPTARLAGVDPAAPLHKALGFVNGRLPTFLAPPAKLADATAADGLRVAHASCRRAGAGSLDAMAGIAPLIDPAGNADQRPHQLYLTGDQIYADDIATTLLPLVIALGADVMGASQPLPGFPPDPRTGGTGSFPVTDAGLPGNLANLPPKRRKWLLWQLAGFTGSDTENHAITFGEFAALYLLAWSPRVWRKIPAFADVFKPPGIAGGAAAPAPAIAPWLNRPWFCGAGDPVPSETTLKQRWSSPTDNAADFRSFNSSAHHLARYAGVTPLVAQVLANTPTYMIFDDHEVADDWNLNGRWATKVYNREWGRYVVRNGLLAYTLMQAWGNDPAHFGTDKPGRKLLDAAPAAIASGGPATDVDILLGFEKPTTAQPKRVVFNYTMETESYKVAVLDTRTHRAINNTTLDPPNLIDNLDEQLPERPATATQQALLVVSPVPVFSPVVIEQVGQPLAQLAIDNLHAKTIGEVPGFAEGDAQDPRRLAGCGGRSERGGEKYDREGWSANEQGFEAVVARLASWRSVVILSGDVHYASTTTLDYWTRSTPAEPARLVQCISSPAKNVFKDQVDQIIRKVGNLQRAEEVPMERLAWRSSIALSDLVPAGARVSLARRSRLRKEPALVPTAPWPKGSKLPAAQAKQPDWRWRIRTVVDMVTKRDNLPDELETEPLPVDVNGQSINQRLVAIAVVHQERLRQNRPLLRRVVFAPNFGTVRFEEKAGGVEVAHRLHTPVNANPFPPEREPLPDTRPVDPPVGFGPHTVHRAPLTTPPADTPPTIIAEPAGG